MDQKSDVEFVFTAACVREKFHDRWDYGVSRDTQSCLLFGQRNGDLNLHNRDYHEDIAKSEVTRRYLGTNFIILPYVNTLHTSPWTSQITKSEFLIATNAVDKNCRVALDNAKHRPVTIVRDGVIEYTDGLAVRDTCGLPDKFVIGCGECPTRNTSDLPNICALAQLASLSDTPEFTIETYIQTTKYWETAIGRFYAIGPALTSQESIGHAAREIDEHDFKCVNLNRGRREKGAKERIRRQTHTAEVCSQCSMRVECHGEGGKIRCTGYHPSPNSIANTILRSVHNPFTEFQMRTLLHNSGLFAKYYNKRKCYGTLRVIDHVLQFVLIRKLYPRILEATQNYNEAISWIKKYHGDPEFPPEFPRFKKQEKAALIELAGRAYSPRYYNAWRTTAYPLWCITQEPNGNFCTTYAWSSGRLTLPWSVRVHDLKGVYKNYQNFKYADAIAHRLSYRHTVRF